MKTPLSYQISEYDCGPTTLQNAISFLFDRKQISPDLIKSIHMYCLDSYNKKGELGKFGTSGMVMGYLASWLNHYSKCRKLPIHCDFLQTPDIHLSENSRIIGCLQCGGCAIARVHYGTDHYILLTGVKDHNVMVFDPYYREVPFHTRKIKVVSDQPDRMNRIVDWDLLNSDRKTTYALGPEEKRECMLLYNTQTYQQDNMEYII